MLTGELVVVGACGWGGRALWSAGHPGWAAACFALAGLTVVSVVATWVADRESLSARTVLGRLFAACVGAAWLAALLWFVLWLDGAVGSGTAILVAIVGLWGVPLLLAALGNVLRHRRP